MSFDAELITTIIDRVESHAMALGLFQTVNGHEPKSAPGNGTHAAFWVDSFGPAIGSGLHATSMLFVLNARVNVSMTQLPADAIDPKITSAIGKLIEAYTGDFELGGIGIRCVDLLGMGGGPTLGARAGYLTLDNTVYRVMTLTVPIIIDDIFDQVR